MPRVAPPVGWSRREGTPSSKRVPAAAGVQTLEADMTGTYGIEGDRINFDQDADTFVRDAD